MKKRNKFLIKSGFTGFLTLTLVVAGSLAWQDISQHKTNKFSTKSVAHSMVLVEDFEQVEGWTLGQDIRKEISVRNGQESDDTTRYAYNNGYVRLQIREFMGVAEQNYVMSEDRLMIETKGDFLRFETKADADAKVAELGLTGDRVIELQGINDEEKYFYIKTQADDNNGQYGKFLVMNIETGDLKSIVDDSVVVDLDKDTQDQHNNTDKDSPNLEDTSTYTTHLWSEGMASFTPTNNVFSEYVNWTLGQDVISLQQWKDTYNSKPVAKWIVDTTDTTNGYVYWGQRLDHATHANALSTTTKLLESVQLIKQPQGHAEYRIHVNMDAVSFDDLELWSDGNHEIIAAYKSTTPIEEALKQLELLIEKALLIDVSGKTPSSITVLEDSVLNGKNVLKNSGPGLVDIKEAIRDIENAIKGLVDDGMSKLKDLIDISKSDVNYQQKYCVNVDKWDQLHLAITQAEEFINANKKSGSQEGSVYNTLFNAYEEFKDGKSIGLLGDYVYVADREFKFVKHNKDTGDALILSSVLTYADYQKMNKTNLVNNHGLAMFYRGDSSTSKYIGYKDSNLEAIDVAFYETFVEPHNHSINVNSVNIPQEAHNEKNWDSRSDLPTVVDASGMKTAFSLSVSDINDNNFGDKINIDYLGSSKNVWLRSPGYLDHLVASLSYTGQISNSLSYLDLAVRPALWVKFPN